MNRNYFKYLSIVSVLLLSISIIVEPNIFVTVSLLVTFLLSVMFQFKKEEKSENNETNITHTLSKADRAEEQAQ